MHSRSRRAARSSITLLQVAAPGQPCSPWQCGSASCAINRSSDDPRTPATCTSVASSASLKRVCWNAPMGCVKARAPSGQQRPLQRGLGRGHRANGVRPTQGSCSIRQTKPRFSNAAPPNWVLGDAHAVEEQLQRCPAPEPELLQTPPALTTARALDQGWFPCRRRLGRSCHRSRVRTMPAVGE